MATKPKPKISSKPKAAAKAKTPAAKPKAAPKRAVKAEAKPKPKAKPEPKTKVKAKAKPAAPAKPPAAPAKAPAAPAPRPPRRVAFDAQALAGIKESLLVLRAEYAKQLEEIEEASFTSSQSDLSGEVGYDEDYADAGSFTFEREKDLSIANNVQDLLDKIAKALDKIDEGTYGLCESCGEAISAERLKALPYVLLCIKCKKAEERR